jgi:hypothetical protein
VKCASIPASGLAPLRSGLACLFGSSVTSWRARCFLITSPRSPLFLFFSPSAPPLFASLAPFGSALKPTALLRRCRLSCILYHHNLRPCKLQLIAAVGAFSHSRSHRRRSDATTEISACVDLYRLELSPSLSDQDYAYDHLYELRLFLLREPLLHARALSLSLSFKRCDRRGNRITRVHAASNLRKI